MASRTSRKAQSLLDNWFRKPKEAHFEFAEEMDEAATVDDMEGATLPPPSEPRTDVEPDSEDELAVTKKKGSNTESMVVVKPKSKRGPTKISEKPRKKLLVAQEPEKSTPKPRKPRASGSTAKEGKATRNKSTQKAKRKGERDEEEEEEVDEDAGSDDDTDKKYKSKAHPEDLKLPPLSTMPSIFNDIVTRNPRLQKVAEIFHKHNADHRTARKLRVGTMCSGTESPLLALQLISEAMEQNGHGNLEVEHIFSCEIEPFKQAYIERNFRPPILFRDVTELGGDEA